MHFIAIHSEIEERTFAIYESNEEYFMISGGALPTFASFQEDQKCVPPNFPVENKVFGVYEEDGEIVGIVDLLKHYPNEGVWYIGLLLVDGHRHHHGLGKKMYHLIEKEAIKTKVHEIKLAVIKQNQKGLLFWKSLGFQEEEQSKTMIGDVECEVFKLHKRIGDGK